MSALRKPIPPDAPDLTEPRIAVPSAPAVPAGMPAALDPPVLPRHQWMLDMGFSPRVIPDTRRLVLEDGKPVENIEHERHAKLAADALHASYRPPGGEPFVVLSNVGVFPILRQEAVVVPDILLSVDVEWGDPKDSDWGAYFPWVAGHAPSLVVEVASPTDGGETGDKMRKYARIGVPHYAIVDTGGWRSATPIRAFELAGGRYRELTQPRFPELRLGMTLWDGEYLRIRSRWLRFTDWEGRLLATHGEREAAALAKLDDADKRADDLARQTDAANKRADDLSQKADEANKRADEALRRAEELEAELARLRAAAGKVG